MTVQVERRVCSVDEYHRMVEAGILSETDRVELIEGEVIRMSPIGSLHAGCVKRLNTLLHDRVGQPVIVSVQDPVWLDEYSEPQPDIAVLKRRPDYYSRSHPTPDDILLIIEVADTSIEYDRSVKLPLYAQAGIPEVWLADLSSDVVEVYSEPAGGGYQKFQQAQRGGAITPQNVPGLTLSVNDILG